MFTYTVFLAQVVCFSDLSHCHQSLYKLLVGQTRGDSEPCSEHFSPACFKLLHMLASSVSNHNKNCTWWSWSSRRVWHGGLSSCCNRGKRVWRIKSVPLDVHTVQYQHMQHVHIPVAMTLLVLHVMGCLAAPESSESEGEEDAVSTQQSARVSTIQHQTMLHTCSEQSTRMMHCHTGRWFSCNTRGWWIYGSNKYS